MCDPATAMLVISTAKAGADYFQGQEAAKAQEKIINAGYEQERLQTQRHYEEINQASQDQKLQRYAEHLIEQGRLRAIAGETGLAGNTQGRIFQEEANNAAQDMATLESNRVKQTEQTRSQGAARQMQARAQLAGIRRPSGLLAALQIADAGANYFKPPAPTK